SRYELRVLRKDGSVGWVEMSAGLIKWDGWPASLGIAYDITERKQAERELRTSRDLLRAVTEGTLDVIFVKDLRGHYLMMNPAGARHLGLSPEAVVGRHDSEFFGPESARCFREQESGVVRTGEARTFEYPLTYPDATTRTFLSVKAPARDESGQIVGIIGVAHDITERKRAETALAENERRFRELAQTAPTAIFVYDGSRIVYANPATEEITGYSREELLVLDPHEMVHPDFRGQVKARAVARLRGEAVPGRYELPMLRRDGTTRWVDLSARVLNFDSKPAILVIAYDITDRKRAEEAALMAEMKYRAIFEQSVVGNFQSTPEGRFLMVNQAMARMYGYDSPGEMTRSVTNIGAQLYTDAKRRTEYRRMLEDLGRVMDFEAEHRRKDGSTFWTSDSTRAVRDAGGRLLYYEGTVQDITARKQAEAALRRLSGRLLTLQDEERRRIARELHDSTAQNLAALIMNLGAAEKGAARMNLKARRALTEGLALAKQSAREIRTLSYLLHPPMLDEFGLAAALRWYVHGFSERSGIRLELEMPRKLRRLPPDVERTLFRITQEALANLRQHSASKRAKVVLRRKNGRVELEVRDYGKGLLANGRHPQRPMGVGLVGMRERVDQLEGQLVIEPAKPKGTRVRVWLPVGMGKP
ncbi:MAG TPA: PAS domain S-box protein, partial [Terriglobales bacterium]|nr:PAS domain S-box protein [Terriglobales bacterium]